MRSKGEGRGASNTSIFCVIEAVSCGCDVRKRYGNRCFTALVCDARGAINALPFQVSSEDAVQDGSLNVENVLWANTVLASGRVIGVVVYTGRETRSVMNTTLPESKVGLLDLEVRAQQAFSRSLEI